MPSILSAESGRGSFLVYAPLDWHQPRPRRTITRTRTRTNTIHQNRKMRHLQAITLRNLALAQDSARPRRGTIDDEGLPASKRSPAKMVALREANTMLHSKSSDDLRPIHESAISLSPSPTKQRTPPRPSMAKLRRRSTLEWAAATSHQRQRRLQDVSAARMADLFYSLHIPNQQGRSVLPSNNPPYSS